MEQTPSAITVNKFMLNTLLCLCVLLSLCSCGSSATPDDSFSITAMPEEYRTYQLNEEADMLCIDFNKTSDAALTCTWQQSTDGATFTDIFTASCPGKVYSCSYTPPTDKVGIITYRVRLSNGSQTEEAGPFTVEVLPPE